jgi:hypothetical protein
MHTEVTKIESGGQLEPGRTQAARPQLLAVLPLLEQVSRDPANASGGNLDAARAAGVPDDAIADALHVSLIFGTVNRLANAFGFAWESDRQVRLGAQVIHRLSYRLPRFLLRE